MCLNLKRWTIFLISPTLKKDLLPGLSLHCAYNMQTEVDNCHNDGHIKAVLYRGFKIMIMMCKLQIQIILRGYGLCI